MGKTISIAPRGGTRNFRKKRSYWRKYTYSLFFAVGLALIIRTFFIQAFRIPSRSMEDSLLAGDFLLVDKFAYGARVPFTSTRLPALTEPRPGDIVLFKYPLNPERVYVKRCIATAGQVVEIRNKVVYVDGSRLPDPPYSKYVDARIFSASDNPRDNYGPQKLPEHCIFVMGDNRDNSRDSRHWGILSQDLVVGKAWCIYWSCEPDYRSRATAQSSISQPLLERALELPRRIRWKRLGAWVQ